MTVSDKQQEQKDAEVMTPKTVINVSTLVTDTEQETKIDVDEKKIEQSNTQVKASVVKSTEITTAGSKQEDSNILKLDFEENSDVLQLEAYPQTELDRDLLDSQKTDSQTEDTMTDTSPQKEASKGDTDSKDQKDSLKKDAENKESKMDANTKTSSSNNKSDQSNSKRSVGFVFISLSIQWLSRLFSFLWFRQLTIGLVWRALVSKACMDIFFSK